ncbi:hypothetical protein NQ317_004734 [Molorchus minor]|uniref:Tubulin--tyrosine ligase-like protein 5 n=1 Tax=Molorchus minor TaxID=1323400 RepID=A0ABQ9JQV7_9CUCU|nr:hypothetical protein NQ317_004734 [Molorchus minor]
MDKTICNDLETDSSQQSFESVSTKDQQAELIRSVFKHYWNSYKWKDDDEDNFSIKTWDTLYAVKRFTIIKFILFMPFFHSNKIITQEPGYASDIWLVGGPLGSKNAVLLFRSSALANASELSIQEKPAYKLHITYKVLQAETKLLAKLLDCHGITEVAPNSSDFNLLWTGSHPKPGTFRSLAPHQRINHFPRSYELTRKDRLYKNIERMQHIKGVKNFDFIPQTFVMPMEYRDLCTTHHKLKGPWIVKPVASSRGRGIFIVETPHQVPLEEPVVVAKYISNPLLVAGHKCDLRLYVVVTSIDPLLIYIYEEGLVRFATVKYDSSHKQLWNPCMHLCNYSINKYHSDYVKSDDPSAENVGHKWTLSALLRHLKGEGKDTALLMSQIEDMVIKAVLAPANSIISACKMFVPNPNNCFELYGFDILIDDHLKPWLLEVNLSPSLNCDSPLDVRLKSAMLADLLSLIGIPAVDPILRPSTSSITHKANSSLKMRLGNCRRVHSADGLSNNGSSKRQMGSTTTRLSSVPATPEEMRLIHPTTGIPIAGTPSSSFSLNVSHNYNLLLYTHFFPENTGPAKPEKTLVRYKYTSLDHKRNPSVESLKTSEQREARKTFSHYLICILKRIVAGPDKTDHVEIVLKFLQKASNYLRTPFSVKAPSLKLESKDRAAMVAKQLNDFLYLYNRETEMFVDKSEKPSQIPTKLYNEFLENARECDLEEVLIYQTTQATPSYVVQPGFQGILKCIPNVSKPNSIRSPYRSNKAKGMKVSSVS